MDVVQTDMDVINMILDVHPGAVKSVDFKDEEIIGNTTIVVMEVTKAQFDFISHEAGYKSPAARCPQCHLFDADTSTYKEDGSRQPSCVLVGVWRGCN